MNYIYGKDQKIRGTLPDVISDDSVIIVKGASFLRLTYQIKLLTYMVVNQKKLLKIFVNKKTRLDNSLKKHIKDYSKFIKIERK
jgi:hypothetical protein